MTLYPQSILDEIRDRISIVSYIGEHIPLKKSGRNHKGLCPFHGEKTPSFMVSDEKEIFHCFGCGEGGNIFKFVMKYEGLSFPEAVEHLATRAGVALPKKETSKAETNRIEDANRKKKFLLRVNQIAASFFREMLLNGRQGDTARNYLKSRGISDTVSAQHFLGYADDSWDALTRHLEEKKVPLTLALELGLVKRREGGGGYYDFFRGRLIFPIISHRKEILGFGGRIIDDKKDASAAKYINSPDSMIYHKSHSVYGLNVAQDKIRKLDQVVIVEGYMDVLALNEAGIANVVAPLGTALTTSHIRLVGRCSKNMVLLFDGDAAGIQAAERSLAAFIEAGIMPKVVNLPDGCDPDNWIKKSDKSEFESLIASADSLFSWFIKKRSRGAVSDPSRAAKVIAEVKPYFLGIADPVEFMQYRKILSDELKVDESDLILQMGFSGGRRQTAVEKGGITGRLRAERILLALLLDYPEFIPRVTGSIDANSFSDESHRSIFELILEEAGKGKFSAGKLLDRVADDALADSIHSLFAADDIPDDAASEAVDDCLSYLARWRLSEKLKNITEEIKSASMANDEDRILQLMSEKKRILTGLTPCE